MAKNFAFIAFLALLIGLVTAESVADKESFQCTDLFGYIENEAEAALAVKSCQENGNDLADEESFECTNLYDFIKDEVVAALAVKDCEGSFECTDLFDYIEDEAEAALAVKDCQEDDTEFISFKSKSSKSKSSSKKKTKSSTNLSGKNHGSAGWKVALIIIGIIVFVVVGWIAYAWYQQNKASQVAFVEVEDDDFVEPKPIDPEAQFIEQK